MFVRVVRFTNVDKERMQSLDERIEKSDGPPEGITATGVKVLVDEEQETAVVLQYFDSMEDMKESEKVFEAMDASETPGTRDSIDRCEIKAEMTAG
jgi:hypothetical protein